ncbi:MAG: ParE family toxin-like protein [Candidatus Humimicrobiaceae bacterium]
MHLTANHFWKYYNVLPENIRNLSRKNFEILKKNPYYPSIHFKKIGKFWSVRIGDYYRALAIEDGEDYIWFWIGTHNDYDNMVKKSFK